MRQDALVARELEVERAQALAAEARSLEISRAVLEREEVELASRLDHLRLEGLSCRTVMIYHPRS